MNEWITLEWKLHEFQKLFIPNFQMNKVIHFIRITIFLLNKSDF